MISAIYAHDSDNINDDKDDYDGKGDDDNVDNRSSKFSVSLKKHFYISLRCHFSCHEGTLELLPWENPCREELLRRKARFVNFPSYEWEIITWLIS